MIESIWWVSFRLELSARNATNRVGLLVHAHNNSMDLVSSRLDLMYKGPTVPTRYYQPYTKSIIKVFA